MPDSRQTEAPAALGPAAVRSNATADREQPSSAPWLTMAQALPVLAVVIIGLLNLHRAGDPQDEGALLVYADQVIHGAVAHRDFLTFYGPGLSWLLGGLFMVTGPSVIVERLLWLVLAVGIVVLMTRLARRWGPGQAVLAGAVSAIWLVMLPPSSSPWLAAVGLLLASLLVATPVDGDTQRPWRIALAGLLAALALAFRLDLAPAMVLCAVPLLATRRHRFAWYVGGAAIGFIPLGVHVLVATPARVFQNVFIDAVLRQAPGRRLPIPPTDLTTAVELLAVTAAAVIAIVAATVARRREGDNPRARLLAALAALSVALLPEMYQRADSTHVYYAACVCLATLPVTLSVILGARPLRAPRLLWPALGAVLVAATLVNPPAQGSAVSNSGRDFFVTAGQAPDTQAVLADVDRIARPGQRVFVGPADMRRTNYTATYYLEMDPLIANRGDSRLAADVAAADVLVLTTWWDVWNEPNGSAVVGSEAPNLVVSKLFCLRASDGGYRVYTRCAAA